MSEFGVVVVVAGFGLWITSLVGVILSKFGGLFLPRRGRRGRRPLI